MATFLTGTTFGSTEQVTNTKLHNIVNNASISNIIPGELISNLLSSLTSSHGKVPMQNLVNLNTPATNASLIDVSLYSSLKLFYSIIGSVATFINARTGQQFTLIMQQASTPVLSTLGNFKLAANFIPLRQYNTITLIWDGSVFVEVGRSLT